MSKVLKENFNVQIKQLDYDIDESLFDKIIGSYGISMHFWNAAYI